MGALTAGTVAASVTVHDAPQPASGKIPQRPFGKSGIKDSTDFSARLLEKVYVAVTPGEAFGTNDHVRMSYATSMEQLDKGLKRMHEFIAAL